jgi:uncharacterized protein (DUF58 family)
MNRQAWRDFFITVFFLSLAFVIALLSSVAAEQRNPRLATVAAAVSLVLALLGALYIIPRLARNVRLEILRFAIRTTVTVEGLLFLVFLVVIAFAAWNTANNLLYLILSAMLAFLVAANLLARISLADMSVQLRFPDHIFAGETASINVTLLNHKRFMPSYSLMIEALSESGEDDDAGETPENPRGERHGSSKDAAKEKKGEEAKASKGDTKTSNLPAPLRDSKRPLHASASHVPMLSLGKLAYFVLVPAQSSARQRVEHKFLRRGRYPITGFRIATKFPAGFFKKWRRIDATGEILVYPKPKPLDDFYHTLPMLVGQIESHVRGSGDDLYAIRRYQASDHMRYIDWKATAKSTEMMVREHMREDEWRLTIVFDTSLPPAAREGKHPGDRTPTNRAADNTQGEEKTPGEIFEGKFEQAVVMAASLANHFILERADVELITTNDQHNVTSGSGNDHLYKILRSLATIQPAAHAGVIEPASDKPPRRGWGLLGRSRRRVDEAATVGETAPPKRTNGGIAWRLLDEVPVLGDERRFKVLITSAAKGTIPAHVWRSAHVVFMDDL